MPAFFIFERIVHSICRTMKKMKGEGKAKRLFFGTENNQFSIVFVTKMGFFVPKMGFLGAKNGVFCEGK